MPFNDLSGNTHDPPTPGLLAWSTRRWATWSVQSKITLGLLTIVVLVVVVGGLGIWSGHRVAKVSERIAGHSSPVLLSAEEMKSQTLHLQKEVLSYTLLRGEAPISNKIMQEMVHVVENYNDARLGFVAALERYADHSDSPGHRASYDEITLAFEHYWGVATALVNEPQTEDLPAFEATLGQAQENLLVAVDELITRESGEILEAQTALRALTANLRRLSLGVMVGAFVLSLFIAYRTSRTIVGPILDLKAAAIRLGRGEFLSHDKPLSALASQDEIGVLARAFRDMSDNLEQLNDDLYHSANHDVLTGLANRKYLLEGLTSSLRLAREGQGASLLFLDFDRFKMINDYYGHQVGDRLLAEVGKRLQETVRTGDLVARLGGDEFTVLLADVGSRAQAEDMAQRLLNALRLPFDLNGTALRMTASIGIVLIGVGYDSAMDILRDADIAMYRAKTKGGGCAEVFTETLREEAFTMMALEADLRQALHSEALEVYYQPIVSLNDGRTVGSEALVRWHHPERGFISPDQFIPVAEETGLILELDRLVLRRACAQTAAWNDQFGAHLHVSVNLSGQQFASHSLLEEIRTTLEQTGLEPGLLHLELTETILMHQTSLTREVLRELKTLGVALNMDDFGTGYSSLAYLQHFDVDTLKIDRSFIDAMLQSPESEALVRTILAMADNLQLGVVAEGVETEAQAQHLRELGCELAQGYLFSKPHSADDLLPYLRACLATSCSLLDVEASPSATTV